MSFTSQDRQFMARALELAARGWGQTSPNPLVGAVITHNEHIVGEGYHERFGGTHAEVAALAAAGERARGATLYVTLEPCNHVGKTPPCTDAIIAAGIRRVVAAARDPNPEAAGAREKFAAHGIAFDVGLLEEGARELNAPFFHSFESEAPWVTLKLAQSLDGAIAEKGPTARRLTGAAADDAVQRLRAAADAIAVGVNTANIDDPRLTARTQPPPRKAPLRVVFDTNATLDPSTVLARTAAEFPTVLVTAPETRLSPALYSRGVESLAASDLTEALVALRTRGVRSLLVEGGARLAASFLSAACVNRLVVITAPVLLGPEALRGFAFLENAAAASLRIRLLAVHAAGEDVIATYGVGDR